jgi:hypothetical protein
MAFRAEVFESQVQPLKTLCLRTNSRGPVFSASLFSFGFEQTAHFQVGRQLFSTRLIAHLALKLLLIVRRSLFKFD